MGERELVEIAVKGPGPFGFRLYGGEGDPLIVAKLRSRSKAHDAGLREGDVVLGINGHSCETISHGVAMSLLESADNSLHLHLYRGSTARDSLSAAYQSLGSQLRPVPPGAVPPNRSIFTIQPEDAPQPPPVQPPVHPHPAEHAPTASFSRQQEVTSLGANATQTITTETETQDLGGVTLTKVTRQVVLDTSAGGGGGGGHVWQPTQEPAKRDDDADTVQRAAIFHVPKITAQPLRWHPENSSSAAPAERGSAVDRIHVNKPITVDVASFGVAAGKVEGAPRVQGFAKVEAPREEPATFKVPKTTAKPWIWQPSYVPDLPVRDASPALPFHVLEGGSSSAAPPPFENHHVTSGREEERGRGGGGGRTSDGLGLSPDLIRVLTTEPEDDWAAIARRRKIFADSSFYDDPEAKYPTIEEQIKMARKVALSLSAPDNVTARGQRMFMKCKEKANQSTSDQVSFEGQFTLPRKGPHPAQQQRTAASEEPHQPDLYYNPTPWKTPQTTKKVEKVTLDLRAKQNDGYPEDAHVSFSKNRALFERGVGRYGSVRPTHYDRSGKKIPGTGGGSLAPQACPGLVNDLKGMRGKGAKLFAQRRAKLAEEEAEEEGLGPGWHSEGEVGVRERSEERGGGYDFPDPSDVASARRLEELIGISKAYLTPWESTAKQHIQLSARKEVTSEDHPLSSRTTSEQQGNEGSRPSFLGKASGGVYRPVRFHAQSTPLYSVPGVSEF